MYYYPAAFRRLCVETPVITENGVKQLVQPPSGGCVLKPSAAYRKTWLYFQPPSGGCVLKRLSALLR